jgi:hypothetical protein
MIGITQPCSEWIARPPHSRPPDSRQKRAAYPAFVGGSVPRVYRAWMRPALATQHILIGVACLFVALLVPAVGGLAAQTVPKGLFEITPHQAHTAAAEAAPEIVPNGCIGGGNPECHLSSREVLPCTVDKEERGAYQCTVVVENHRDEGCGVEFQLIKIGQLQALKTPDVPPRHSDATPKIKVRGKWHRISVQLFAPWHAPPGYDTETPCLT